MKLVLTRLAIALLSLASCTSPVFVIAPWSVVDASLGIRRSFNIRALKATNSNNAREACFSILRLYLSAAIVVRAYTTDPTWFDRTKLMNCFLLGTI